MKGVGRGIDNVAVQGRWPLTTGVAQGRYYCITSKIVLACTKHAKAIPMYKKKTKLDVAGNYRPVSVFTSISKTLEKAVGLHRHVEGYCITLYFRGRKSFTKSEF